MYCVSVLSVPYVPVPKSRTMTCKVNSMSRSQGRSHKKCWEERLQYQQEPPCTLCCTCLSQNVLLFAGSNFVICPQILMFFWRFGIDCMYYLTTLICQQKCKYFAHDSSVVFFRWLRKEPVIMVAGWVALKKTLLVTASGRNDAHTLLMSF